MGIASKASWFYRYYSWLRQRWGFRVADRSSLCPVFQSTLWLTILTILISPLCLFGWCSVKGVMILEWVCDNLLGAQWIGEKVSKTWIGKWFSEADTELSDTPFPYTACIAIIMGVILSSGLVLVYLVSEGLYLGIMGLIRCFFDIPWDLWIAIQYVGFLGFCACYGVGCVMQLIADISVSTYWYALWLFTNGPLWLSVATFVLKWGGALFAAFLVVIAFWRIHETGICHSISAWCKARIPKLPSPVKLTDEQRAAAAAAQSERENRKAIRKSQPSRIKLFFKRIFSSEVGVNGHTENMFTFIGLVWEFVKALKRRACPLIEFMDPDEIEVVKNPKLVWKTGDFENLIIAKTPHGKYSVLNKLALYYAPLPNDNRNHYGQDEIRLGEFDDPQRCAELHNHHVETKTRLEYESTLKIEKWRSE